MSVGWLASLPDWVLAGLALGGVMAAIVATVFAAGARAFPAPGPSGAPGPTGSDGGETRRREEIRRYLRAIEEPFREDHPIDGREVAFFLPDRDVAITFDAQQYFRLGRSGVHAILAEHELPGARLGDRLPFETPDLDDGTRNGAEAAFAVLGLPPTASREEVRSAYREQIKQVHPDHGGDPESFQRVREAYDVAKSNAD